jgi:hypothetical protein
MTTSSPAQRKSRTQWWFWTMASIALSGISFICLIVLFAAIGGSVSGGGGHVNEKPFVLIMDLLSAVSIAAVGASGFYAWWFRPFAHLALALAFFTANSLLLVYAVGVGAFVNSL